MVIWKSCQTSKWESCHLGMLFAFTLRCQMWKLKNNRIKQKMWHHEDSGTGTAEGSCKKLISVIVESRIKLVFLIIFAEGLLIAFFISLLCTCAEEWTFSQHIIGLKFLNMNQIQYFVPLCLILYLLFRMQVSELANKLLCLGNLTSSVHLPCSLSSQDSETRWKYFAVGDLCLFLVVARIFASFSPAVSRYPVK